MSWKDQLAEIKGKLQASETKEPKQNALHTHEQQAKNQNKPKANKQNQTKKGQKQNKNKLVKLKPNQHKYNQNRISSQKSYAALRMPNLIGPVVTRSVTQSESVEKKPNFTDIEPIIDIQGSPSTQVTKLLSAPDAPIQFKLPPESIDLRKKQLVIGLDFGTAFTKIVVGDITYAYAVPFFKNQYLLPSQLYIDKQGICSLNKNNSIETINNLKLPIILDQATDYNYYSAVAYLALVLSHSRAWVASETNLAAQPVNWLLNAGLPAATYDDKKLNDLYKRLMQTAWALSYASEITIIAAKKLWHSDLATLIPLAARLSDNHFALYPEFIAQIVGYVQSPSRRQYSHLLVDVGAGTLDVAFFTIKNEYGDWCFYTYGQQVKPLGVEIFYRHRLRALGSNAELDNTNYPSNMEFMRRFSVTENRLHQIDKPFMDSVARCIFDTLRDSDQNYLGGAIGTFAENITTFLCGGGASVNDYSNVLSRAPSRYPLELFTLPIPQRLMNKGISKDIYHRISVAYGLSFDPFNIGQVIKKQRDTQVVKQRSDIYSPSDYILNDGN